MDRRWLVAAGAVVAALVIYLMLPSEERKVKKVVFAAAEAIEEESLIGLGQRLSRQYVDGAGRSYETVLGAAKSVMDGYDGIDIDFVKVEVQLNGTRARVPVTVRLDSESGSGGKIGAFFGDGEVMEFDIGLTKETVGWRITSVDEK